MKNRRNSRRVCQVAATTLMMGLGVYANAQSFVVDGAITVTSHNASTVTPTVSNSGLATNASGIVLTDGQALPTFSFELTSDSLTEGDYVYNIGFSLDDNDNVNRRLEAVLEGVTIHVDAGGVISIGDVTSQSVRVAAKRASGDPVTAAKASADLTTAVSAPAGVFTLNAQALIDEIGGGLFEAAVFDLMLSNPRHYTYTIAANQTSGVTASIRNSGATSAFPRIQTSCEANTASQSSSVFKLSDGSGAFAAKFGSAYALQGQFSVAGSGGNFLTLAAFTEDCAVSSGGGSTGGGTAIDNTTNEVNDATNAIVVVPGQVPDATVITNTQTVIDNAKKAGDDLVTLINSNQTVQGTTVVNVISTFGATFDKGKEVSQAGGTLDTQKITAALGTATTLLDAVKDKNITLTSDQKTTINTKVTQITSSTGSTIKLGTSDKDTKDIVNGVSALVNSTLKAGIALNSDLADATRGVSNTVVQNKLDELAASKPGLKVGDTYNFEFLNSSEQQVIFNKPVTITIPVVTSSDFDTDLLTLAKVINSKLEYYGGQYNQNLITTIRRNSFARSSGLNGFAVESPVVIEQVPNTPGYVSVTTSGQKYQAIILGYRQYPSYIPDGIFTLETGTILYIKEGVGIEFSAAPLDLIAFLTQVKAAGFDYLLDNSRINIELGSTTERFSGVLAFDNLAGTSDTCGALNIVYPTGTLNAASYAFSITCANGAKQNIQPFVEQQSFYEAVANAGLSVSTDRNTGFVTIPTVGRFKPSFFVNPLTVSEQAYLNTNGSGGFAFKAADVNGDGVMDYTILHSTGAQVLYGAP